MEQHQKTIARELNVRVEQVAATATLFDTGATVPFIARYRKEVTGSLDETQITAIRDRLAQLAELDKRREAILSSLAERELLSKELNTAIQTATDLTALEDLYLPHRPKRRTRSSIAKENGLEALARAIFAQDSRPLQPQDFVNPAKEVHNADEALAGARDIMAEWISEDPTTRARLRRVFTNQALIISSVVKKNKEAGIKFRDYFDWQEAAAKTPGHRFLAMLRGENEKVLTLSLRPPKMRPWACCINTM